MAVDRARLREMLAAETAHPAAPVVAAWAEHLCRHFGSSTAAVLFYGAGLHQDITPETLLDFYVLVDDPRVALKSVMAGWAAMALPPNVYLVDMPSAAVTRAKVAVIGTGRFMAGMGAFLSHLWGRFSQPALIVYARTPDIRADLVEALAEAVESLVMRTLPLMPPAFTAEELWIRGVQECYRAEVRPENSAQAEALIARDRGRYPAVTAAILGPPDAQGVYRSDPSVDAARAHAAWASRRRWGKAANLLRLMKAAFTFRGGLDYAVAKIAKHSGVAIEISDRDRRHPLIAGIRVFLEARRRGGVR
jgi:hypothetical protein